MNDVAISANLFQVLLLNIRLPFRLRIAIEADRGTEYILNSCVPWTSSLHTGRPSENVKKQLDYVGLR
jgi:hypothetical protein